MVSDGQLVEIEQLRLDLEKRLEEWLKRDISILDPNLLVIGQQVQTDYGDFIDLLCLDEAGDLVVVELKKDKTPREVTAQALDYGSWVTALSNERITAIAEGFLGSKTLDEAFEAHFQTVLPETLGQDHKLLVVGSAIDAKTERIINYLSETHGVNINAATFQYFRDEAEHELLVRVFVVDPGQVDLRTSTKGTSKRRPKLTYEQLEGLAEEHGVANLYRAAVAGLETNLRKEPTHAAIRFTAVVDGTRRVVLNLFPADSSDTDGLRFRLYSLRVQALLGISEDELIDLLPARHSPYTPSEAGFVGFDGSFATEAEVDQFVSAFAEVTSDGRRAQVSDLLKAQLLSVDDVLIWRRGNLGREFRATVTESGAIRLSDGREFATPSRAASEAAGGGYYNGWRCWWVERLGATHTLDQLRLALLEEDDEPDLPDVFPGLDPTN